MVPLRFLISFACKWGGEGGGALLKNDRKKSTWTTYRREFQTKNKKSNHVGRRHCLVEAGWRAEKSEKQKRKKTQEEVVISCVKAAKCGHTYLCVGTEFLYPRVYPSSTSRRQLRLGALLILCQ